MKKQGKDRRRWKTSKSYERTRRRKATRERKLAAHRKSLHGHHVHEIVAVGNTVILEKISYKAWQIGLCRHLNPSEASVRVKNRCPIWKEQMKPCEYAVSPSAILKTSHSSS